jgi:hypothetical protein
MSFFCRHEDWGTSVAVLADGRRVLSGSYDRTLRLWDLQTGACLAVFTGDTVITAVAVVRDDLFVASSAMALPHSRIARDGVTRNFRPRAKACVLRSGRGQLPPAASAFRCSKWTLM